MPELMQQPDAGAGDGSPSPQDNSRKVRLRLWPAILIAMAHLAALVFSLSAPTVLMNAVGVMIAPVVAVVLLSLWWLTASRAPGRDRVIGFLLLAGVLAGIALPRGDDGTRLLIAALPVLTLGCVVLLLVFAKLPWRTRRWAPFLLMLACVALFSSLRSDGVHGNLTPMLSWRWSLTSEEILMGASSTEASGSHGAAVLPAVVGPGDWPGFRGPNRDGRLQGVRFSKDWAAHPPRELWRRPVGLGWSSFTVAGDYVFTQEQRGDDELVVCYAANSGEEVWVNRLPTRFEDRTMGSGPRATPTLEGGKLFTFGATGMLQCLDAATGTTEWKRDIKEDAGIGLPQWGFASSPLISGDLVFVFCGGRDGKSVGAYDRSSGDLRWQAGDGTHGYSSVHLATLAEVPQLLMNSDLGVQAFAPDTGELLWEHRWEVKTNPRVVQPFVGGDDSILIGTAGGMGTRKLDIRRAADTWTVEEEWTTRGFRPYFNDFVYYDGHCYGFDGSKLACIDAATGEIKWEGKRYGGQVLLIADMALLLILSEKGELVLVEANPDVGTEIARIPVLEGKTWNHPVVAHGKIFVRNSSEAVCFELPA